MSDIKPVAESISRDREEKGQQEKKQEEDIDLPEKLQQEILGPIRRERARSLRDRVKRRTVNEKKSERIWKVYRKILQE